MELIPSFYQGYAPYLVLALLGLVALLIVWLIVLHCRLSRMVSHYRRLTRGVEGQHLEAALEVHLAAVRANAARLEETAQACQRLEAALQHSLQRVGLIRFNPFEDTGGDQSFSLALLDNHGDGVVISSLHGRSATRMYAKPVRRGTSRYPLSAEEEQAIYQATLARPALGPPQE